MGIRVQKDGWEVSADTVEELEEAIAVVQRALERQPPSARRGPGRPPGRTKSSDVAWRRRLAKQKKAALKHLRAINGAGDYLSRDQFMAAMSMKHTREVGAQVSSTNALLKKAGLEPSSVYSSQKAPGQPTRWQRGEQIEEAIQAIEKYEGHS